MGMVTYCDLSLTRPSCVLEDKIIHGGVFNEYILVALSYPSINTASSLFSRLVFMYFGLPGPQR